MVASIGQMASAEYYLESQRSFRHPNEYYTAGEEPDGTWFNPKGLFGLEDGVKVDAGQFQRLYNGFAPDGSGKLVQRAGNPDRSPGVDMTFSVDKSVSALWALAEPETRERIEAMAVASARAALEDSVLKYCSYTRVAEKGVTRPVEADLMGATFVHGTSRENDPQLHVHCTIFNFTRTREDGKWRAHHQYPVYSWKKAAGALFRAYMAWELQQGLGARIEQYGPNAEFTRIAGMPDDLKAFWSKRRKAIVAMAGELGIPSLGNASRMAGVNKLTREGKSHDNDPEVRHRRWREESSSFVEREELIASVTGHDVKIPREAIRELTDRLDDLPAHLAREEAVFRRPDMVEAAANAAAGLMGRDAVGTTMERLRRNPEIERLEPKKPTAESRAGMVHTEVYSTRHNLGLEQAVRDMAEAMDADSGHGLPEEAVNQKVETLLADGYPLSQEQSLAIRYATARGGRVAVIEGAAGSGKTTTLRPITDLHREHGYEIVPTAVAWRTAVALGDDCNARPYCVDKLLKLAAKGQVEIGRRTLIVVDEAGMLSTRQAHHILQLSERHGAKVVFAGDTRQQQPVEAGPGLRLIRDVAGSVRVDRIRRQKADLEDVLVHVHGETPEQARFRAGLTNPQERDSILADYEAMDRKPLFTPWQVSVSEALRDGEAEQAIEAWRLRGRLHLCHDEEKTLTRLVDDWGRHVRAEPDAATVVLARTRAEARALSWLMRQRVLAHTSEAKRAVIEVSRDLDGRLTEPLEIAVGDRLRIGATQWDKQLFNGTVVTVEALEVRHGEGRAARPTGTRSGDEAKAREPEQPSVLITARTDDGRRVTFRHDEIRDYKDNIRIDYGYAMTIASAQGLTVDRTFLLVDDRPARETIYPAATRHREGIDIYVNRSPLAFDIADRRPEDQAEMPVTDSDVRAYLAERWSRSQPKEAALDYVSEGAWRDAREAARAGIGNGGSRSAGTTHDGAGDGRGEAAGARFSAANDNAFVRIAAEIRHAVNGWRHGAAVEAFATERGEVLEAWDELRERIREEGEAVALSPAFRETLERHAALLKRAETFRARQAFEPLLAERGGIGRRALEAFEALHDRARRHRRAATMRAVHQTRREAEQPAPTPAPERRQGELALEDGRAEAPGHAGIAAPNTAAAPSLDRTHTPPVHIDSVPPPTGEARTELQAQARAETAREDAAPPAPAPEPAPPDWWPAYESTAREWKALVERARRSGTLAFYTQGYADLIPRIRVLAENPDIPAQRRAPLNQVLQNHERHLVTRKKVEDFLAATERHMDRRVALQDAAVESDVAVAEVADYPDWRREAERLTETGEAILSDRETHGPHLAGIVIGEERTVRALFHLRDAIGEDDEELALARREAREQRRRAGQWDELRFAKDTGAAAAQAEPATPDTAADDDTRARRALWQLRRVYDWDGRLAERNREQRIEADLQTSLESWETLRRDWNRQVKRAEKKDIHVIYTRGYKALRTVLRSMADDDPYLDYRIRAEIGDVLFELDKAEAMRKHVEKHRDLIVGQLKHRREEQDFGSSWDKRAFSDRERYDAWRDGADQAVDAAARVLVNRRDYAIHLDGLESRGKSLALALSQVREVLREDDRHIATTLAGQRKGEDERTREERIARLLDDPEKLRELRRQRAERREAKRQRKGRYQSRGIGM